MSGTRATGRRSESFPGWGAFGGVAGGTATVQAADHRSGAHGHLRGGLREVAGVLPRFSGLRRAVLVENAGGQTLDDVLQGERAAIYRVVSRKPAEHRPVEPYLARDAECRSAAAVP